MSRRTERIASTIQQELAMIILHELQDPRLTGMPSITRVKVSDDLSIADVYLSVMGTETQQNTALNALRHSAGLLRSRLTHEMTLRVAPFLKFHIDEKLKKELALLDLLRKVKEESDARNPGAPTGDAQLLEQVEAANIPDEPDDFSEDTGTPLQSDGAAKDNPPAGKGTDLGTTS
jgi:ribosome-binding factor A